MLDCQFYSLFREPLLVWVRWIGRNQELIPRSFVKMKICRLSSSIRDLQFFVCSHGAMVAALGAAWCWTCRARELQRRGGRSLFGENLVSSLYTPEFWCECQYAKTAIFSGEFSFFPSAVVGIHVKFQHFSHFPSRLYRPGSLVTVPRQSSLYEWKEAKNLHKDGPSRGPVHQISDASTRDPDIHSSMKCCTSWDG